MGAKLEPIVISAYAEPHRFLLARSRIVSLYNRDTGCCENCFIDIASITKLEYLFIFTATGVDGGLTAEIIMENPDRAVICFAALEQKWRKKGVFTFLINLLVRTLKSYGVRLIGVELNDSDSDKRWKKLGFTIESQMANGVRALIFSD